MQRGHLVSAERDAKGHLLPGHSLGGRPAGTSALGRLRALIEPHKDEIVAKLIETAKAGGGNSSVRAAEVLLDRIAAKPRPASEIVSIPGLKEATTSRGKCDAVIAAVATGEISATAGRDVMALLDVYARAIRYDEFEERLRALEGRAPRTIEPDPDPERLV